MAAALPFVSPVLSLFVGQKKAKAPAPVYAQPTITPRANSIVADTLAARRGSASNMRTGAAGAESTTGKKTLLGQ